jgi:ferredoxin/flavodoxin
MRNVILDTDDDKDVIGLYFSGTGNTKYCVERFVSQVYTNAKSYSIEDENLLSEIRHHEWIVVGFPVYYSSIPKIMKDYVKKNASYFRGKKVFIITTKGLFNGAGIIHAKKLFQECGSDFIGSAQFNMPDNIRDLRIMELAFSKNHDKIIAKATRKIEKAVGKFKANKFSKSGLSVFHYAVSFALQVLWFYPKNDAYISAPKIDHTKCNRCRTCVHICPMKNIQEAHNKIASGDTCTICYRCFSSCPRQALTILGHRVYDQYRFPKC